MKLDRELQKQMLDLVANKHPGTVSGGEFTELDEDFQKVMSNAIYLTEHGLIASQMTNFLSGRNAVMSARITAKGQDFLADDGGLSAILGTVTVKLHEETLRDLIASGVLQSSLPQSQKMAVQKTLQELPSDSIKHLTMRLLDLGLENAPAAMRLIQSFV